VKTTAIIVAAGTGSRFKSDTPKQFLDLAGKPVIVRTLERTDYYRLSGEIEKLFWSIGFEA
jgi:2-C-methyl-D-erythritol 4-phosphate cytidylyltransferase